MTLRLVSRSSQLAVPLDELVQHVRRQDTTEDDRLLERFSSAAERWAENYTGLALVDQTWDYFLDAFPSSTGDRFIRIPKAPLLEARVYYRSTGLAETEFTDFLVDYPSEAPGSIYLTSAGSWPTPDVSPSAVRIRFRAGFIDLEGSPTTEGEIPEDIKAAICIYASTLYENREAIVVGAAVTKAPWGAEELLRMRRVETSIG